MAIKTDVDLFQVFGEVIEDVVKSISERAQKLLREHINMDTYHINKTNTEHPKINDYYLNGTGIPSYEFRDEAWDIAFKNKMSEYLFSLFYDGSLLSPPSANNPDLHGNYSKGIDRREILPDLLNVSGEAMGGDMDCGKSRDPFWDNFEKELCDNLGKWLYTEFNNRGLKIPDFKSAKFG